jgi:hypothetical protein
LASEIEIGLSSFSDDHRGLSYFAAARATWKNRGGGGGTGPGDV